MNERELKGRKYFLQAGERRGGGGVNRVEKRHSTHYSCISLKLSIRRPASNKRISEKIVVLSILQHSDVSHRKKELPSTESGVITGKFYPAQIFQTAYPVFEESNCAVFVFHSGE